MTRDEVAEAIIGRVLKREGGVGQNPGEAYVTRYGQTPAWLAEFHLPAPETRDQAATNYCKWLDLTKLIEVCDVLDSLADATIDYAVHSGHQRAIRALQSAIGARPDGVMGSATIAALVVYAAHRRVAAADLIAGRDEFQHELFASKPEKYLRFARNWGHRIGELIRGLGV